MNCVKVLLSFIALMFCFLISSASPVYEDLASAASEHEHGRVQIKVYRGPSDHHHNAPWGYWVKQPADEDHHH